MSIRDRGRVDATLHFDLTTHLQLTRHPDTNQAQLQLAHCKCDVRHLDLTFNSDWLYQIMDGVIERQVRKDVEQKICEEAEVLVNEKANAELATLPTRLTFKAGRHRFNIDYTLAQDPLLSRHHVEIPFNARIMTRNGEISNETLETNVTNNNNATDEFQDGGHMIAFHVTQQTVQESISTLYRSGVMSFNVRRPILRKHEEEVILRTTCASVLEPCFGFFFPQTATQYPHSDVRIRVVTTDEPIVSMHVSHARVALQGRVEFYAVPDDVTTNNNNNTHLLFSINAHGTFHVHVKLENMTLVGEILDYDVDFSLETSNIGSMSDPYVYLLTDLVTYSVVVPRLNELGAAGIKLPMIEHVSLANPTIQLLTEAVYIGVDVAYGLDD